MAEAPPPYTPKADTKEKDTPVGIFKSHLLALSEAAAPEVQPLTNFYSSNGLIGRHTAQAITDKLEHGSQTGLMAYHLFDVILKQNAPATATLEEQAGMIRKILDGFRDKVVGGEAQGQGVGGGMNKWAEDIDKELRELEEKKMLKAKFGAG